jgi:hypothetical protein
MEYLDHTVEMVRRENKICLLMGDFNIDLLKANLNIASDNFLNSLGSYFFQPQILQPTRITNHSSTLIDTIFFKSNEHFVIRGNLVYDLTDHLPNFIDLINFRLFPQMLKYIRETTHCLMNQI